MGKSPGRQDVCWATPATFPAAIVASLAVHLCPKFLGRDVTPVTSLAKLRTYIHRLLERHCRRWRQGEAGERRLTILVSRIGSKGQKEIRLSGNLAHSSSGSSWAQSPALAPDISFLLMQAPGRQWSSLPLKWKTRIQFPIPSFSWVQPQPSSPASGE